MLFKIVFTLVVTLSAFANAAIVGAPRGVDKPFAIELPDTSSNEVAARDAEVLAGRYDVDDDDSLECGFECYSPNNHCCLVAGLWPRCHPRSTPCSRITWPGGMSAHAPKFPDTSTSTTSANATASILARDESVTVTETLTRPGTTVTKTVEPAAGRVVSVQAHVNGQRIGGPLLTETLGEYGTQGVDGPRVDGTLLPETAPGPQLVTETTVQIVSVTATTVVPITISTVPAPGHNTTTASSSSAAVSETSSSPNLTTTTTTSSASSQFTATSSDAVNATEQTGTSPLPTEQHKSTILSTSTVDTTTSTSTSTAVLNGDPFAVQSTLGADGAVEMYHGLGTGRAAMLVAFAAVMGVAAVML